MALIYFGFDIQCSYIFEQYIGCRLATHCFGLLMSDIFDQFSAQNRHTLFQTDDEWHSDQSYAQNRHSLFWTFDERHI